MTSSLAILEQIADALGLPVSTFFEAEDEPMDDMSQTIRLVAAFSMIKDPVARRQCLAFVRASAGLPAINRAKTRPSPP